MERKNIIFDSQILNTVQECAFKVEARFNQDLTPATGIGTPIEEGDLLHQCKEMYNLALMKYKTELIYDNEGYANLLRACIKYGQFASTQLNLLPSESDTVLYQFEAHCNHTRMDGVMILEVERPFIKELFKDDELGVYYTGKIDRFTNTPNFGNVPRDYKKVAQRKEPEHLSNQFTGYCVATDSNVIIVDKVGFQKTLPPEERFKEYVLYYNDFQKQEWINDTIWWVRQYAFYIEENTWPRNRTSCDKYGGCIFRIICDAQDNEMRSHIIKTKFIIGDHWDPTAVLSNSSEKEERRDKMIEVGKEFGFDLET